MITTLLGVVSNLGLSTYILKQIGADGSQHSTKELNILKRAALISVSVALLVTTVGISIFTYWNADKLPDVPRWSYYVGVIFFTLNQLIVEYYRGIRHIAYSTFVSTIVTPGVAALLIWLFKIPATTFPMIVCWLIAMLCVTLLSLLYFGFIPREQATSHKIDSPISMLQKGWPFFAAAIFVVLNEWIDKLILTPYISSEELGHYDLAYRLASFIFLPLLSFNTLLAPKVAEHFENKDKPSVERSVKQIIRWAAMIATPIIVFYMLFGKWVLSLFGTAFTTMYIPLLILSVGMYVNVVAGPVGVVMKMTNLQNIYMRISAVSVAINALLNLILVPHFGSLGAAIASCIGLISINVISWAYIRSKIGINTSIFG